MRMKPLVTLCIACLLLFLGIALPSRHVPNHTVPNQNTEISTYGLCPPQVDIY